MTPPPSAPAASLRWASFPPSSPPACFLHGGRGGPIVPNRSTLHSPGGNNFKAFLRAWDLLQFLNQPQPWFLFFHGNELGSGWERRWSRGRGLGWGPGWLQTPTMASPLSLQPPSAKYRWLHGSPELGAAAMKLQGARRWTWRRVSVQLALARASHCCGRACAPHNLGPGHPQVLQSLSSNLSPDSANWVAQDKSQTQ